MIFKNSFGQTQIPIDITIKKAINWFKENGYIKKK